MSLYLLMNTASPESELYLYRDTEQIASHTWRADRALATTLHYSLREFLGAQQITFNDLAGIGCFAGPGSFTGLRIGMTVANALGYCYKIPVVSAQDVTDQPWLESCLSQLRGASYPCLALPFYGAPAFTTTPKK